MAKVDVGPFVWAEVFNRLVAKPGALLGTVDAAGRGNVMTIGWGHVGVLWRRPVMVVYVRPSRHSYTCLEQVRQFTVNVAGPELAKAVGVCGSKSGRDMDKFAAAGLTGGEARAVRAPVVEECALHYECTVVHYNDFEPMNLRHDIQGEFYPQGDYHRAYFGVIEACWGDEEKLQALQGQT